MSKRDPLQGAVPGAALQWAIAELGGIVTTEEHLYTVTTNGLSIAKNNPDRVALIVVNVGTLAGSTGYAALTIQGAVAQQGVLLTNNGGSMILTLRDDFTLPTREWWMSPASAPTNIYTIEYIRMVSTQ